MPLKIFSVVALAVLLPSVSLEGAQLKLRYGGAHANGDQDWLVLLQPDAIGAVAVEIGFQFTGGSIISLQPNVAVFDDLNPGQNPFTGSVTTGVSIHNGGSRAFAALGGVVPELLETLVMTLVTDGPGSLSLGGQNHNGSFTGARVWQGAGPVDSLTATLQVTGTEADFNLSGRVDGADFLTWQRGFGTSAGAVRANGDANSDGAVNNVDLAIWRGQFGTSVSATSIPEPSSIIAAVLLGLMLLPAARARR